MINTSKFRKDTITLKINDTIMVNDWSKPKFIQVLDISGSFIKLINLITREVFSLEYAKFRNYLEDNDGSVLINNPNIAMELIKYDNSRMVA